VSSTSSKKQSGFPIGGRRRRHLSSNSGPSKRQLSPAKTRHRRASSLDRERKSKHKHKSGSKSAYHSDNEINPDAVNSAVLDIDEDTREWNNADESTDEEYFKHEFKNFVGKKKIIESDRKSTGSVSKKKKGFHFKQKYIFQRKRKGHKLRGAHKQGIEEKISSQPLDELYSFNEEVIVVRMYIAWIHTLT